jgi:hypothetical protein
MEIPEFVQKWVIESKHDKWPGVRRVWEEYNPGDNLTL